MMENKWQLGDMVKLKSGGPDMTIYKIFPNITDDFNGTYRCQWFAGKKLESGDFAQKSLISVIPESK